MGINKAAAAAASNDTYVKDASGKFFQRVPIPSGGFDYLEVEDKGLQFLEVGDGIYVQMRDVQEFERQRDELNPSQYLSQLTDDPMEAKRAMRRIDAFQAGFEDLTLSRVTHPGGKDVEVIKDEKYFELQAAYTSAITKGEKVPESEFRPLSTYAHKLTLKNGKVIRPLYKGEVGMRGSTVLVLQEGYGTGTLLQVPRGS